MDNKRDRILKSALKLFTTHGFHGTPTSRIAKEAGVATGTLFHYFATKQDLIDELYLESKSLLIKTAVESSREEDDVDTWLWNSFNTAIRWGIENSEKYLFFEQFYNSPNISPMAKEEADNRAKVLFDLIEKAKDEGMVKKIDLPLMVDLSYNIINAVIKYILDREITDENEISRIINDSYKVFLDAIKV